MRSMIVHGGAWQIPDDETAAHLTGLASAISRGVEILLRGASAIDVVVEIVAALEDDPTFDAGRGSVLNRDGRIEMDASVMDGASRRGGACACISDVANPVRLARAIMEDGRAVFLAGEGASRFAREVGIPACGIEDLLVERELLRKEHLEALESYKTRQPFDGSLPPRDSGGGGTRPFGTGGLDRPLGTVGAVCRDADGRLAAATSTGGAPYTFPGRVGDSPVLGAGTWAEDGVGAASATGWGEGILRDLLAFRSVQEIDTVTIECKPAPRADRSAAASVQTLDPSRPAERAGIPPGPVTWGPVPLGVSRTPAAWAAREAIRGFARRVAGVGGVILLGPDGTPGFAFNTPRMARGFWIEGMGEPVVEIDPALPS